MAVSAAEIVEKAIELGYDKCGIIPVEMMRGYEARLEERMEHFPETRRKYEGFRKFAHPEKEFPWEKAIVIVSFWYGKYRIPDAVRGHVAKYYLMDGRRNIDSAGPACRRGSGSCARTISSIRKRARINIWRHFSSMSRCSLSRRAHFGPARRRATGVYEPAPQVRLKGHS